MQFVKAAETYCTGVHCGVGDTHASELLPPVCLQEVAADTFRAGKGVKVCSRQNSSDSSSSSCRCSGHSNSSCGVVAAALTDELQQGTKQQQWQRCQQQAPYRAEGTASAGTETMLLISSSSTLSKLLQHQQFNCLLY
jgi:hypothetical protein